MAPMPPLSPGLRKARRAVRFQRFGAAKGVAGAVTTVSLLVPAELLVRTFTGHSRMHLAHVFHRGFTRSLGIRTTVHGVQARQKPVLYVANHLSWADIPVLGARIKATFVAKSEVGGWGVFGWLANFAQTVYVERSRRASTGAQRDAISDRLARGDSLILFPEGTNSDGVDTLPFKSSLFAVTAGLPDVLIQPVTIAYTRVNGLPVTRERLPDLAWIGDTELMPHALGFMSLGRVRAEILFHPPVRAADFANRKLLAAHCERVIAEGYRQLMRGRLLDREG
jgi:1-acyl-sn-glycerol-3-phosphate acyltransferase